MILLEYQNIKKIFAKTYVPNWSEELFKKLKTLCHGYMLLIIVTKKKLWNVFWQRSAKKQIKTSLELKK